MTKLRLLAAVALAATVIGAPAMARDMHRVHRVIVSGQAVPGPADFYGRSCVPAPRVGAFATAPWSNDNVPCEPYGGYGYTGYGSGYGGYAWDY